MSWDVVGLGAVAAVGGDPGEIFEALCAGTTGLAKLRAFDLSQYRTHYAYEIDDRSEPGRDEPLRATRWLLTAVDQALAEAGLTPDTRVPVLVGTTLREQRTVELWWRGGEMDRDDLHFGPALAKRFGLGRTFTFANACAAGLYALGMAADLLDLGMADAVVVAGTDSITESAFGTLDRVQNRSPQALRPFDKGRAGMVMGEGAAAVVLVPHGGRSALARVRAVGMNCDAYHPTAPDRASIATVMRETHQRAGIAPDDLDLVMLHGSGTELNDAAEAAALATVFAPHGARPLLTAIKSMTGHTLGGSGLLSLVMAVRALRRGLVPPIAGLNDPIDELHDMRPVVGHATPASLRAAQVNAFGFGGINAVAVLERAS